MKIDHNGDVGEVVVTEHANDSSPDLSDLFSHERYRLLELIGEGSYSRVYRAEHKLLGETVAIKLLKYEYFTAGGSDSVETSSSGAGASDSVDPREYNAAADDSVDRRESSAAYERFKREAQLVMQVQHPNIVSIRGFGFSDRGQPFLVLEYCKSKTLEEILLQNKKLSAEQTLSIAMQLAAALAYAHSKNVIHRDIKPSNVLLLDRKSGLKQSASTGSSSSSHFSKIPLKLVDFGLAKQTADLQDGSQAGGLTISAAFIGTPNYMSPEACLGQKLDARSDIYSFGCVLYECLSGRKVFAADSSLALMDMHLNRQPDFLPEDRINEALKDLTLKCLSKKPEARYQSFSAIETELLNVNPASSESMGDSLILKSLILLLVPLVLNLPAIFYSFRNMQTFKSHSDSMPNMQSENKIGFSSRSKRLGVFGPEALLDEALRLQKDLPGRPPNYTEAEKLMKKARALALKQKKSVVAARALLKLAMIYNCTLQYQNAEKCANTVLKELEHVELDHGKYDAYRCLGDVYFSRFEYERALKAHKSALSLSPPGDVGRPATRRSIVFDLSYAGKHEQAIKYAFETEQELLAQNLPKDDEEMNFLDSCFVETYLKAGRPDLADKRIYEFIKQNDEYRLGTVNIALELACTALRLDCPKEAELLANYGLNKIKTREIEPRLWDKLQKVLEECRKKEESGA